MPAMREGFTPPSEDDETSKAPKTDGEGKKAESRAEQKRAHQKRQEAEKREEAEKAKAARLKEQPVVDKAQAEVPYKDAKEAVEVISAIQDEKKVVISHGDLAKFKKLLVRYGGLDQKIVDEMEAAEQFAEIIVAAQSVLRNAKPIEIDEESQQEEIEVETPLKVEKTLVKKLIAKVQSEGEETLTAGKVAEYLTVIKDTSEEVSAFKEAAKKPPERKAVKVAGQAQEETYIIESFPHLENSSREQVVEAFKREDVPLDVPNVWEKMDRIERQKWLERHKVINTTQFPEETTAISPEEPKLIFEDKKEHVRVLVGTNDKVYLSGIDDLEQTTIEAVLEKAGIGNIPQFPKDWTKKNFTERRDWLRSNNIEALPAIAGGAVKWADNDQADFSEAIRRMTELVDDEVNLGTAGFNAAGYNLDRQELNERLLSFYSNGKTDVIFSTLLDFAARGITNSQQRAIQGHLDYLVANAWKSDNEKSNYRFVYNFNKTIEDFERRVRGTPQVLLFDSVISVQTRAALVDTRNSIGAHFINLESTIKAANPDALEGEQGLYNKLKINATSFRDSLRAGLYGTADRVENDIFDTVREEEVRELPGQKGLLEWHAVNLVESIRKQYATEKELGVPIDWRDSMRNVLNNLRYVESTDFPAEELQQALGRINSISEAIPPPEKLIGSEKEEAEVLQRDINEMKKAVQAVYILRTNMEGTAMTPDEIVKLFHSNIWNDGSYRMYFKRFFKDHRGNDLKDAQGHSFNLLDKAKNVIDRRFTYERRVMNRVSEMTMQDLNAASTDLLEQWFVQRMQAKGYNLNEWGRDMLHTHEVINEWYRENLLLGAHGLDENGRDYLDLRKEEVRGDLRNLLSNMGLTAEQIKEYEDVGLLKQVINNAYYLNWSWGTVSDYDVIAIWDRNKRWFGNRPRLGDSVHNNHSDLWGGRMVDHFAEFILEEKRGRSGRHNRELDVNYIFQKHMVGKYRDFLPHNRLSVKMISDNLRNDETIANALVGGANFKTLLDNTVRNLENREKLDIDGDDDDRAWAEGAAIAEMVEDGVISFENIEWSRVFDNDNTNVSKFNMGDWWSDRATTYKYFGPDAFQTYLQTPNTEMFFEINSIQNFYSKRENRIKPWMKLVIPAHIEIGKFWKKWWKLPYNMPHAEKEEIIDFAAQSNRLEAEYHHWMKTEYLGWGALPGGFTVRRIRQLMEAADVAAREIVKGSAVSLPFLYIWEFLKALFGQMQAQFAGR